jgi:hypothetical protein
VAQQQAGVVQRHPQAETGCAETDHSKTEIATTVPKRRMTQSSSPRKVAANTTNDNRGLDHFLLLHRWISRRSRDRFFSA